MPNPENLIPIQDLDKEKARMIQSAGGKACQKKKKEQKTFQNLVQKMLDSKITDDKVIENIKRNFPSIKKSDISARTAMISRQYDKAIFKGDTRAFEALRDTAGEKPVDVVKNVNPIPITLDKNDVREFADDLRGYLA